MRTKTIELVRHWRAVLLLLAVIPALTNCSRIDGSVALNNSSGEPYSFEGASVEAFDLDAAAILGKGDKTQKGLGRVESADGAISLVVVTALIDEDALYSVEIRCPAGNAADACNVESPLHVVLSGTQLKASGWKATALSEAVFHNIAYYAAADYPVTETQQMLDRHASALLKEASDVAADYADLLAWDTEITDAVRRPHFLGKVSEALATGISNNDLKRLLRQWVGPYVAQLELPVTEDSFLHRITIANGHAYISASESTLRIIDINNPEQPALASPMTGAHSYRGLRASGNRLYSQEEGTLYILDISNPQQPADVGETYLSYDVKSLAVAGDYVYALKDGSFLIVDARDPSAPVITAEVQRGYLAIAAFGTTVAVSDYGGFHLIDASNPAAPRVRSNLPFGVPETDAQLPEIIMLSENHAYAATYGKLTIVDISNLDAPAIVATLDWPGIQDITLEGTQLYLTAENTIVRVDVSDPAAPVVTATIDMPRAERNDTRVAAAGEFLYTLTLESTFSVVDIDRATGPVVQSGNLAIADTDEYLHFFATSDHRAYLQDNRFGFSIIDTRIPATPGLISTYASWLLIDASVIGDHAFTIDYLTKALSIVDVSDPEAPVALNNRLQLIDPDIPFDALRDIAQSGNQLYVSWGFDTFYGSHGGCPSPGPEFVHIGGLFVIDASAPTTPALTGQVCLQAFAEIVAVGGNHAYLGLADGLLQVVDVNNPASPTLAGAVQLSAMPNFFAVTGNHVWATEGRNGIEIIDVSNPAAPVVTSRIDTAGHATSVTFDEHYAYVADGISGILTFDISNPATPVQITSTTTSGNAMSVVVLDDHLYAATKAGVEVFKALAISN